MTVCISKHRRHKTFIINTDIEQTCKIMCHIALATANASYYLRVRLGENSLLTSFWSSLMSLLLQMSQVSCFFLLCCFSRCRFSMLCLFFKCNFIFTLNKIKNNNEYLTMGGPIDSLCGRANWLTSWAGQLTYILVARHWFRYFNSLDDWLV